MAFSVVARKMTRKTKHRSTTPPSGRRVDDGGGGGGGGGGGDSSDGCGGGGIRRPPQDGSNPITLMRDSAVFMGSAVTAGLARIPAIYDFSWSVLMLVVMVLVIALVVYLAVYYRPQVPALSHSSDFDVYMSGTFIPDFVQCLKTLGADAGRFAAPALNQAAPVVTPTSRFSVAWGGASDLTRSLSAALATLLALDDVDLADGLRLYFAHFRCFASRNQLPYSMFCPSALSQEPRFCVDGKGRQMDPAKVAAFEAAFVAPVEVVRNACQAISVSATSYPGGGVTAAPWYAADPNRAFAWLTAAHKLRMYLNEYHDQINESAMSRVTDPLAVNTWVLYYIPFVSDVIMHRIPDIWAGVPSKFLSLSSMWTRAWEALGNIIVNIPCDMVFTGDKRAMYCKAKIFSTS